MSIHVLRSADGKRFEIIQVTKKLLGTRAGKVGQRGKSTTSAFGSVELAKAAARARVKELKADGFAPASLADIS
jgi:predicted DNA-binding WGR domain protein